MSRFKSTDPVMYASGFCSAVCGALDRLEDLKPNWDGYGAPTIRKDVIDSAKRFVTMLPENLAPHPRVVPLSTGNLQLEWHRGSKILELEFEDAKTIHYLQWYPEAGMEVESTFPASDVVSAVGLIKWFTNGDAGA